MYNSKPGHDLIFQTTPLLAGPLLVAKCVQCHQPTQVEVSQDKEVIKKMGTNVDRLIQNYQRGKELFISQACYGCHRIAGFSRASVGPELTQAGNSYPWYIKESIVWPQADLPSSTMPNFRLDHQELADLMTFLMGQKGETKAISEVDYQTRLMEWEKGEKMPWEKPLPPTHIENIRSGQLVFASEGCAACHKLKGFESNIGLQDTKWFHKLFPEQIAGSTLAKIVEENGEEIERHIASDQRNNGILEEIESLYPGLIEGFYTNFKFAARAYNGAYHNDPKKLAAYKERLHRVLMAYIQEYGLGRDIAPHLNWSGVFRDNEWLLGHFHNPSAYTARSIMPVMPFDDTKFYMLNDMLHAMGRKNRDRLQEIWYTQGFNPALAYEWLCSSCHGSQRQGNGIIAEWIYPIPKNLRNPIFLRNLTQERAMDSITHGVKGTPMPPWGEALSSDEGDLPILRRGEIIQLVDWLYQNVPYDPRLEKGDDAKWSYMPSDVVLEMRKERTLLKPEPEKGKEIEGLVNSYFNARPNPIAGPDSELYYIGERYYTPENLNEGKQFFITNCATCHGNEGSGSGLRATSMVEAKPRMLTNLPWIRTRDDLRLLRSIKYGVPGTSMIPWGDQTTAAQRMQLVMFIRDLTKPTLLQADLEDLLYEAYDRSQLPIQEARLADYKNLEQLKNNQKAIQQQLNREMEENGLQKR